MNDAASQPVLSDVLSAPQSQAQVKGVAGSDFVPVLAERPETKPLYDSLRNPVEMEWPDACIKVEKKGCRCYTNQGTLLKNIPEAFCNDYVQNGLFNPYKKRQEQAIQQQQQEKQESSGSASVTLDDLEKGKASFSAGVIQEQHSALP